MTRQPLIASMRVVKKETLNLISCWVSKSNDPTMVKDHFLPPLLHAILADYRCNVPQAREPEVLSTVTTIIDKLEVSLYFVEHEYWQTSNTQLVVFQE